MALLRCNISEGPRPGFKTVGIPSVEGHLEYLTIEERFLSRRGNDFLLPVWVVGKDSRYGTVLVSLPGEADSGAHRVWVRGSDLAVVQPDEVPA
jgi:hypothetical protein